MDIKNSNRSDFQIASLHSNDSEGQMVAKRNLCCITKNIGWFRRFSFILIIKKRDFYEKMSVFLKKC